MPRSVVKGSIALGDVIRTRRESLGMTVSDAAAKAGIGQKTWEKYESGACIRTDKVPAVCAALDWEKLEVPDSPADEDALPSSDAVVEETSPFGEPAASDALTNSEPAAGTAETVYGAGEAATEDIAVAEDGAEAPVAELGTEAPIDETPFVFGDAPLSDEPLTGLAQAPTSESVEPADSLNPADDYVETDADDSGIDFNQYIDREKDSWSTYLERAYGLCAAVGFSIGCDLLADDITSDLDRLSKLPAGSHIGQLGAENTAADAGTPAFDTRTVMPTTDGAIQILTTPERTFNVNNPAQTVTEAALSGELPPRFLTHYTYEFLFQLRTRLYYLRRCLHDFGRFEDHMVADELLLHLVFLKAGGLMWAWKPQEKPGTLHPDDSVPWEQYSAELVGCLCDDVDYRVLYANDRWIAERSVFHVNNWFSHTFNTFEPDYWTQNVESL